MTTLAGIIREEIARDGPMRFERFMELALYHPEHGYYRRERGTPRTGRAGDFFTSVSVGPLFGRLLARQFLEMWEALEKPTSFWIIEQGAEDGRLAADILEWCRNQAPAFFGAMCYGLVEDSPILRARQEETLVTAGFGEKVGWFRDLDELAREKPVGVFFANELVDAFPVRRVIYNADGWSELCVAVDGRGDFEWSEREVGDPVLAAATGNFPAIEGYTTEVNLRARDWMGRAGRTLGRGYLLVIDYGFPAADYYAPFRSSGTLTAYREHRHSAEVLVEPGTRDLTAHVDFTALARAGEKAGLVTLGFIDQQHFLTGIAHDELEGSGGATAGVVENLRAWQTLTHPNHLGARFHALLQAKDAPGGLTGLRYARAVRLD